MDSRKIQVLLTTLRLGSFNKAAEELHMTQSAVTQSMNHFEDELGFRVLNRSHNGITLTSAGERILPFIEEADRALARVEVEAREISGGGSLPIRIGAYASIASAWIPAAVMGFKGKHPQVEFTMTVSTYSLVQKMLDDEVDLIMCDSDIVSGFDKKKYTWCPLAEDEYFAVVPRDLFPQDMTQISQERLMEETFIMASADTLHRHMTVKPKKMMSVTSDDDASIASIVSHGIGVTMEPELCLRNLPGNIRIMKVRPREARTLGILVPKNTTSIVKEFVMFVKKMDVASL
ncbi:LysR family transcriptional regulator [Mobilibacterium timonense]|uniref:LysR family transcriptional regulator n=1 Tax=Mobilibacterium timonense TaxID=1871012 RepID=UPI00098677CB|nr:LysR family transcriptional regulator [Mobilibacterium timonense]